MNEARKELIEKIGIMDAWQLAQLAVTFRCLKELSEADFSKFHDLVTVQNVPVFTAAESLGVVVMLDDILSIPDKKDGDPA